MYNVNKKRESYRERLIRSISHKTSYPDWQFPEASAAYNSLLDNNGITSLQYARTLKKKLEEIGQGKHKLMDPKEIKAKIILLNMQGTRMCTDAEIKSECANY